LTLRISFGIEKGIMRNALEVNIGGLKLKNPVIAASGTFGYEQECQDLVHAKDFGAIVAKSITLKPNAGNPPPRVWETTAGMLNAIGLQNEGVEDFITTKLPALKESGLKVIASIAGKRKQDYKTLAMLLDKTSADALEVNISCPNIEHNAKACLFAQDPADTASIIRSVRRQTRKPIIAKLSPNVTDITVIARAAERAGADALSLINTLIGMDVDIVNRRPCLGNVTGGLSGPAIKPVALRMVWQVHHCVKIPIIGVGGIMNTEDAIAFFLCGASAIQVGTANFVDPQSAINIIKGLKTYLQKHNLKHIAEITGALKT
jgi:dihydroorotate dehydrogenase (NAD+) catalytic subunit